MVKKSSPPGYYRELNPDLSWYGKNCTYSYVDIVSEKDLKYHLDWNWLMPVVEKITKIKYSKDSDYYSPYPRTFGMQDEEGNFMVRLNVNTLFKAPTLMQATWLAVVDFIEWYNKQTKDSVNNNAHS